MICPCRLGATSVNAWQMIKELVAINSVGQNSMHMTIHFLKYIPVVIVLSSSSFSSAAVTAADEVLAAVAASSSIVTSTLVSSPELLLFAVFASFLLKAIPLKLALSFCL